jgi:hypothetical protein
MACHFFLFSPFVDGGRFSVEHIPPFPQNRFVFDRLLFSDPDIGLATNSEPWAWFTINRAGNPDNLCRNSFFQSYLLVDDRFCICGSGRGYRNNFPQFQYLICYGTINLRNAST